MDSTQEKAQEAFREVFDDPTLVLRDDMAAGDVEQWDSMAHINLVIALEKSFDIKFATTEIPDMLNVGVILSLIREKTAEG